MQLPTGPIWMASIKLQESSSAVLKISGLEHFDGFTMMLPQNHSLLNRAAAGDMAAAAECVAIYGNIVWGIAKSCTDCTESAEVLSMEIFEEIWRRAKDEIVGSEHDFIRKTAIREILRRELRNFESQTVH